MNFAFVNRTLAPGKGSLMQRYHFTITGILLLASAWHVGHATAAPVVEAAIGKPFGVARVTLTVDPLEDSRPVDTNGYTIHEANQRVFYPAFGQVRLLGAVRQLLGVNRQSPRTKVMAFFLFRGDSPFQVDINLPSRRTVVVIPKSDPELYEQLLANWWNQYVAVAELQRSASEYPGITELYLTSMLSQRFGLKSPLLDRSQESSPNTPQQSLLLVLNTESMHMKALEQAIAIPPANDEATTLPLPANLDWPPLEFKPTAAAPEIEPMAMRVPPECFYIRYGNFNNYLWIKRLLNQHAGSISRIVTMRGHDAQSEKRIEEQLGIRESALASILGPKLISDIALIGRDTYLKDGAAVGVLFESRNSNLLQADLMKQRSDAVQKWRGRGATIKNIKLKNHTVSFASTPDNRLRSFLVNIGNYHLVTNTKEIARRFIEVNEDQRLSLGNTKAFQLTRTNFPQEEDTTVFVYIAPKFFQGLVSPQYQVELRRRLLAVARIELVQMARLVAQNENLPDQSVAELLQSDLLPLHFDAQITQSQPVFAGDQVIDTVRGARGTFLPIPDVKIQGVTSAESESYQKLKEFHKKRWSHLSPLVMRLKRKSISKGRDQLEITAEMAPFERKQFPRLTSVVGPATQTYVHQSKQDAITIQASLQGGVYRPDISHHQMFLGIQDKDIPVEFANLRAIRAMQILRTAPAYVGAHPTMGLLQSLPFGTPPKPDDKGVTRLPFGLWEKSIGDDFSLLAFNRSILLDEAPHLTLEKDKHEAQLRIHVEDLTKSKVQRWFAALDFQRSYQASIGNTRLIHSVSQQFGVPPDEALEVTERILGTNLICALGGEYDRTRNSTGFEYWSSTRWPERVKQGESPDAEFVSPILGWFRGLDARATLSEDKLTGFATIVIESEPKTKGNFFNLLR